MAEAVAGFYAVETAVEGAAAGAVAVSGATVPLHARFQRIQSPSNRLAISGSTANIVKSKVYLLGGEGPNDDDNHGKKGVHVLSFPPDFGGSRTDGTNAIEVDYDANQPEYVSESRPLEDLTDHMVQQDSATRDGTHRATWSRTQHSSVAIHDKIYVLGGLHSVEMDTRTSNTGSVVPLDTILAYDTLKNNYTIVKAESDKCTEGIPEPRYSASCTSSPYPPPASVAQGQGPSLDAHGTIFLHGGFDVAGSALHDTWTFDLGTKAWHKFPSIVDTALQDKSEAGKITYLEHTLWYVNGSTVMHLDLAEHDPQEDTNQLQNPTTLSTGRVGSGQWQVVYPSAENDPAASQTDTEKQPTAEPANTHGPDQPTSSIFPITTGAGRNYLLHFSPSNPQNMYIFQITSSEKTATSLKDMIRDKASAIFSSLPDNWKSGKYEWSKVEVVESSMKDGQIPRPDSQLSGFASAVWEEYGNKIVIWGGQSAEGARNEGWVVDLS